MYKSERVAAVIAAAGESRRMNGLDKLFAPLGGKPVIVRTIDVFQSSGVIDEIILVLSVANIKTGRRLVEGEGWSKVSAVVCGGPRRQDSVYAGLKKVKNGKWVVIHDGARPLVTRELIVKGLEAAEETGSAAAAVPATDTIKVVKDDMLVAETPPRKELWAVQTPQVFRLDIILKAHEEVKEEATDDAALVERLGFPVKLFVGSYDNIKIATPTDVTIAEALWRKRGASDLSW